MRATPATHEVALHPSAEADNERTTGQPEPPVLGLFFKAVSLDSGRISYVDEGAGPVVLLLHGAPLTSLGFVRVIRELRSRHRVIAPDFPGFGRSTVAPGFGGSLVDYTTFVHEFCRALDLRDFYVYLNDSSACIAFPALARLRDRLSGLIVASTVPLPLAGRSRPVKFVLRYVVGSSVFRRLNQRLNLLPWLVATVAPWLKPFPRSERLTLCAEFGAGERRDRIIDIFHGMGSDDAFMQMSADAARTSLVGTPALLLYGQFDPMRFVGAVRHFQRVFPNHTVSIVPLEEHFPILASGALVARRVDEWIRSLPPRAAVESET